MRKVALQKVFLRRKRNEYNKQIGVYGMCVDENQRHLLNTLLIKRPLIQQM